MRLSNIRRKFCLRTWNHFLLKDTILGQMELNLTEGPVLFQCCCSHSAVPRQEQIFPYLGERSSLIASLLQNTLLAQLHWHWKTGQVWTLKQLSSALGSTFIALTYGRDITFPSPITDDFILLIVLIGTVCSEDCDCSVLFFLCGPLILLILYNFNRNNVPVL